MEWAVALISAQLLFYERIKIVPDSCWLLAEMSNALFGIGGIL